MGLEKLKHYGKPVTKCRQKYNSKVYMFVVSAWPKIIALQDFGELDRDSF